MISEGYASARTAPPNVKYAERFAQAQQAARDGRLGPWSACHEFPDDGEDGAVIDSDTGSLAPSTSWRSSHRS